MKKEVTTTATIEVTIIGNHEMTKKEMEERFMDISDHIAVKDLKNFVIGDLNHGRYAEG